MIQLIVFMLLILNVSKLIGTEDDLFTQSAESDKHELQENSCLCYMIDSNVVMLEGSDGLSYEDMECCTDYFIYRGPNFLVRYWDLQGRELKPVIMNIEGKEVVLRESHGIEYTNLYFLQKIRKILHISQRPGEQYQIWDYFGHNFTDQYGFLDLNGEIIPLEFGNDLDMSKVQRVANYILFIPREGIVTKGWNLIGRRVYVQKVIPLPPYTPCSVLVNNNYILLQDPPLLKPEKFLLVGNDTIIHLSTDESEPLRAWDLSGKKKRLSTTFKKSKKTELSYKLLNLSFSSKDN